MMLVCLIVFTLVVGPSMIVCGERYIHFSFDFDETLPRLGNDGSPSPLPSGHAGQAPDFHSQSIHYIELITSPYTQYGDGEVLYVGNETDLGGDTAIYHDIGLFASSNEIFFSYPISKIATGNYTWIRTSVAYQEYTILWNLLGMSESTGFIKNLTNNQGTFASFLGYNTYITDVTLNNMTINVDDDELQGFYVFAYALNHEYLGSAFDGITYGEGAGSTTVPNPLSSTSPIPAGSCVVTGEIKGGLYFSTDSHDDDDERDILVTLRYSTNASFEWEDNNNNGMWDLYSDDVNKSSEQVVDMGTRGLWPEISYINSTTSTDAPDATDSTMTSWSDSSDSTDSDSDSDMSNEDGSVIIGLSTSLWVIVISSVKIVM